MHRGRKIRDVFRQWTRVLESDNVEPTIAYAALRRVPPEPVTQSTGVRVPKIRFEEDGLIRDYLAKNPQAKLEPMDLASFEPPRARRFVARQLEHMRRGKSRDEAYELASSDMAEEEQTVKQGGRNVRRSMLTIIQQEEEHALREAMRAYRKLSRTSSGS